MDLTALRRGVNLVTTIASGTAATFTLVMAVAALGAEPSSPSTVLPVHIQVRWVNNQRTFIAHGNALAMVGDTLLLDRLVMYQETFGSRSRADTVQSPRVHLSDMDKIKISRGIHGHGRQGVLIGGAIGIVLGLAAYASYRSNPYLGEPRNSFAPLLTVVGGGVVGGLLGAGIGALTRTERWERVDRDRLRGLLEEGVSPSLNGP